MKIHLIKEKTIRSFIYKSPKSHESFNEWINKIKFADWKTPADIKKTFSAADLLGNGSSRVVFDIGGNNYRMICKYHFGKNRIHLFVCWIGTHTHYDKLCKTNKQYIVNEY
jgi:mRNA interferase HigB